MYALSTDEPTALEPLRVAIVSVVASAAMPLVVTELRRAAMHVELATADVLHAAPSIPVYVFGVDAAVGRVLADKIVAWSSASDLRPGVIGIVDGGTTDDCEALLAAGFDDAVVTPISARELAGRVRALHRRVRRKTDTTGRIRYGELTLDVYGRSLWVQNKTIVLTSVELAVVRELIKARGKPLSRVELLDLAWGEGDLEVSERAVDNVILRLRRKLPNPDAIETVRSVGFRIATRTG